MLKVAYAQQAGKRLDKVETLLKTRPDSAYLLLQNMLNDAIEKGDKLTEADCHQQIGLVFYNNGNYTHSLDHLLKAEKIFREQDQADKLARTLNYIGHVYYSNKQPDLAKKEFEVALQIYLQQKNLNGIALTYGNLGYLYEKKLIYDSANYYQRRALELYGNTNDSAGMAKIYENMGSIFEDQGKFDSAKIYFENALAISRLYNDEINIIVLLNNLGDINRKTGKYFQGLPFTRQAICLSKKTQSLYQLAGAYKDMAKNYEQLRIFDSAYYYNELSRQLVQDIYSESNNRQIALQETIYEVEKKNNQITQLALDKKINMFSTVGIILGIVLLATLAGVTISRQRLKIKNEIKLNEQNKHIYETGKALMQVELKNKNLEEEKLQSSLDVKNKELSAHMLHLIQKNQLLDELRGVLNEVVNDDKRDHKKQLKQLAQKINLSFSHDIHWNEFRKVFEQVHQSFFEKMREICPELTANDLRLAALIKMSINSSDISTLLGISADSLRVTRYRLRKKMKLEQGDSLTRFIQSL